MTQIQLRRDTAANWTAINPTLTKGEPGFEEDTGLFKIGDGSAAWTSLDYLIMVSTPSSSSDTGVAGQLAYDSTYLYVCISTDQWKRISLSTW